VVELIQNNKAMKTRAPTSGELATQIFGPNWLTLGKVGEKLFIWLSGYLVAAVTTWLG